MSAQLDAFDQKLAGDSWNDTDRRTFGALNNALRPALKETLTPASSRNQPADLETYIASMRGATVTDDYGRLSLRWRPAY